MKFSLKARLRKTDRLYGFFKKEKSTNKKRYLALHVYSVHKFPINAGYSSLVFALLLLCNLLVAVSGCFANMFSLKWIQAPNNYFCPLQCPLICDSLFAKEPCANIISRHHFPRPCRSPHMAIFCLSEFQETKPQQKDWPGQYVRHSVSCVHCGCLPPFTISALASQPPLYSHIGKDCRVAMLILMVFPNHIYSNVSSCSLFCSKRSSLSE